MMQGAILSMLNVSVSCFILGAPSADLCNLDHIPSMFAHKNTEDDSLKLEK